MTTEERALLKLRIGELKRTIHAPRKRFDFRVLSPVLLYAVAVLAISYGSEQPHVPILLFLFGCVVAFTASADAEQKLNQKIDILLEIEDIQERLRNEN